MIPFVEVQVNRKAKPGQPKVIIMRMVDYTNELYCFVDIHGNKLTQLLYDFKAADAKRKSLGYKLVKDGSFDVIHESKMEKMLTGLQRRLDIAIIEALETYLTQQDFYEPELELKVTAV